MKKLVFLMLMICPVAFGQTTEQNYRELFNALFKKEARDKNYIQKVITQTVIVNSATKANFGGGSSRSAIKINLPIGTKMWYYRVTLMDVNQEFTYADSDSFYNVMKDSKQFNVNNLTQKGVDFYILDSSAVQNFLTTGNDRFSYFPKYHRKQTIGFIESCSLLSNDLWIGIKNPYLKDGLKAIIEVVAVGYY